jgi:hypothetical protein
MTSLEDETGEALARRFPYMQRLAICRPVHPVLAIAASDPWSLALMRLS